MHWKHHRSRRYFCVGKAWHVWTKYPFITRSHRKNPSYRGPNAFGAPYLSTTGVGCNPWTTVPHRRLSKACCNPTWKTWKSSWFRIALVVQDSACVDFQFKIRKWIRCFFWVPKSSLGIQIRQEFDSARRSLGSNLIKSACAWHV